MEAVVSSNHSRDTMARGLWNSCLFSALMGGSKPCSLNASGASMVALMDVLASMYLLSSIARWRCCGRRVSWGTATRTPRDRTLWGSMAPPSCWARLHTHRTRPHQLGGNHGGPGPVEVCLPALRVLGKRSMRCRGRMYPLRCQPSRSRNNNLMQQR